MSDLTKAYFDKHLKNLATKDDLKHFATKDDLKVLATKADLKKLATKDELSATREELRDDIKELRNFVETEISELARMTAEGFADLKQQLDVHEKVDMLEKQMYEVREALKL